MREFEDGLNVTGEVMAALQLDIEDAGQGAVEVQATRVEIVSSIERLIGLLELLGESIEVDVTPFL